MTEPLERLIAESEIRRTVAEYCQTCDSGRFDEFAQCFTVNAEMIVRDDHIVGRKAIEKWIAAAMPPERRGKHLTVNSLVEVDGEHATGATDFIFVARGTDGPKVTHAGQYIDEFAHEDGRWRFARRQIALLE